MRAAFGERRQDGLLPRVAAPARAPAHDDRVVARNDGTIGGHENVDADLPREGLVGGEARVDRAGDLAGVTLYAGLRLGEEAAVDRPGGDGPAHSAASAKLVSSRTLAGRLAHARVDMGLERAAKDIAAEAARVLTDHLRIETGFDRLEREDGGREGVDALRVEEDAGDPFDDGVERAAGPVGDDRAPRGHGLERDDAEILFAREKQAAAVLIEGLQIVRRGPAAELHCRTRHGAQPRLLGTTADDHEPAPEPRAGGDREIDALVGHELADREVEVAGRLPRDRIGLEIDRRKDDRAVATVDLGDAPRDEARIGDEMIDVGGGSDVPDAERWHGQRHEQTREPRSVRLVRMVLIPQVAHRRVAIADVHRVRMGDDALRRAGF